MIEFWQNDNTRIWLHAPKFVSEPTNRMEKAQDLTERDGVQYAGRLRDGMQYSVKSCMNGGSYTVVISKDIRRRSCDCQDYSWRKRDCKHIYAACMFLLYEQLWSLQFRKMNEATQRAFAALTAILKEKS